MIDRRLGRRNLIRAIMPGIFVLMVFVGAGAVGSGLLAADSKRHITAELACQEPPHCKETGEVIGEPTPFYKDYFGEKEEVWVALDPKIIGQISQTKTARIYIVGNKTEGQWVDNSELVDISGKRCGDQFQPEPEEITFQPGDSKVIFIQAWKKPVIWDDGYDVVVDFKPFGKYNKGVDIIDGLKEKGFFVPKLWVCLESITFNYNPDDDIMDGINLRMNALEEVHIPEWKKGEVSYPAAYIKNRAITVKAVFSSAEGVDSATIRAVTKNGCLGNIVKDRIPFVKGRSFEQIFDVTDCTPNNINTFIQEWEWYIDAGNNIGQPLSFNINTSRNKIFILLEKPQYPWKSQGQTEPWCDVLEETCKWARNTTSPIEAAEKITKHLHTSIGGSYDPCSSYAYAGSLDCGIDFTEFFNNVKNGQPVGDVNCFDMGKALVTFANTIGCGLVYRESFLPDCTINCIKEMGSGWNCEQKLGIHGFGSIGKKIFDACFKLDKNCFNGDRVHNEIFAVNINWEEYKKYLVNGYETSFPKIYPFRIDGIDAEGIGFQLRERIDWAKKSYDFDNWENDKHEFISGIEFYINGLLEMSPQFNHNIEVTKNVYHRLEKILGKIYSVVHHRWISGENRLEVTAVIGPNMESVKEYFIIRCADTSSRLPIIKKRGPQNIGIISFGIQDTNHKFSSIDFIRHNVLMMMKANGKFKKILLDWAKNLDLNLLDIGVKFQNESVSICKLPIIEEFYCIRKKINLGEKSRVILKIRNPEESELTYYWEISGGGIEKNCKGDLYYYGSEPGKHLVKLTLEKDEEIFDSKCFKITVLNNIVKNKSNKNN